MVTRVDGEGSGGGDRYFLLPPCWQRRGRSVDGGGGAAPGFTTLPAAVDPFRCDLKRPHRHIHLSLALQAVAGANPSVQAARVVRLKRTRAWAGESEGCSWWMTAAAAVAPWGKKPELSQSASFPARGTAGAKKASTVTALPKQDKPEGKSVVPNGSAAASGRGIEKNANLAQIPATSRSMPVKPESVDSTPNDASSEVQESSENTTKPYRESLTAKLEDDVHSTTSSTSTQRKMLLPLVLVSVWRNVLRKVRSLKRKFMPRSLNKRICRKNLRRAKTWRLNGLGRA